MKDKAQRATSLPTGDLPKGDNLEDNAAMRQAAILEKIRQSPKKQLQFRDIIAAFPDASERTLRYDLQRLSNQGILERIGQGGPANFYKVREI